MSLAPVAEMTAYRWGVVSIALLTTFLSVSVLGSDRPRTFKSGIDLVTVDVCVRDAAGHLMPELAAQDFLVLDNGKPQQIAFFLAAGDVALRAVLVVDRSASMRGPKLSRAVEAASQFAASLGPDDQLAIIAFNEDAAVIQPFDSNPARARTSLASLTADGMTALNEALIVAANYLARARQESGADVREAIVVLTDGEDTSSAIDFEEVLSALRRSGALVYAISLRAGRKGEWLGANWPLLKLAADTGGRALGVPHLQALPDLYREIDAEVRHLYRIGYVPNETTRGGEWRTISVRVPSRGARVRTRTGYYASHRTAETAR